MLLTLILVSVLGLPSVLAQDAPSQIELATGNLAQRLGEDITLEDLAGYEWNEREFADASLGCPQPGEMVNQ